MAAVIFGYRKHERSEKLTWPLHGCKAPEHLIWTFVLAGDCWHGIVVFVTGGSPTLSATSTAARWQISTTWTVRCTPILLRVHCIANKYSYLMIWRDADGRLCSARTSGIDVCQYITHNLPPPSSRWETTMTSVVYNQQYKKQNHS